jgi:hypothetical protein
LAPAASWSSALARAPLVMRVLLVLLALGAIGGTAAFSSTQPAQSARRAPGSAGPAEVLLVALIAQTGAAMTALTPLGFTLPETWVGILVALSVDCLHPRPHPPRRGLRADGIPAARSRWAPTCWCASASPCAGAAETELVLWTIGLVRWAVSYGIHAVAAMNAMQPGDLAHPSGCSLPGFPSCWRRSASGGGLYLMPPWAAA